jgi:tRNA U38,U39,U40 pseudouridine synthase TruA
MTFLASRPRLSGKASSRTIYTLTSIVAVMHHIDVVANAFHIWCCIAGVDYHRPRRSITGMGKQVLDARDRAAGGITAPAAGLYLVAVHYPERFAIPRSGWLPEYGR